MEKTQERVLAYQLAKELDYEELKQLSGGANASVTTQRRFKVTGHSPNLDIGYDVVFD